MQTLIVSFRKFSTSMAPCDSGNQEEIVYKLDVLGSLFAIYTFCGILQKNFAFKPSLRILQASIPIRDVPFASSHKQACIFRNQMVISRRAKRRMIIRIFRMFKNERQPDRINKMRKHRIRCTEIFDIKNLPAKIPADQPQIDFDIAIPVDPHHIRVCVFPAQQMIAEQIQILCITALFIKHRNMQHKLHAVHFPHMFCATVLVTTDIDLMRKRLRECSPCRNIQMPVNRFKNID